MTTEKMEETINKAIQGFVCEHNINILPKVFFDYGLKEYFKHFCSKTGIKVTDKFQPLTDSEIFDENTSKTSKTKLYTQRFTYIALLYEGGIHMRLEYKDMRTLLLYGLFHGLKKSLFDEIHTSVKEKNQLDEVGLSNFFAIINKTSFRNISDLEAVLADSLEMFIYYKPYEYSVIDSRIAKQRSKMRDVMDRRQSRIYVFSKIRATEWITRWAKMKAFKRNWPIAVKEAEERFIEYGRSFNTVR